MLYQFKIELSDFNRDLYQTLEFRTAQHSSETANYLLTRVLAYVLSYRENLNFSREWLNDSDAPALLAVALTGEIDLWIEVGNPSPKKLHKANKAAAQVKVYTYRKPEQLIADLHKKDIYRIKDIQMTAFDVELLESLEPELQKNNRWTLLVQDNRMDITIGEKTFSSEFKDFWVEV